MNPPSTTADQTPRNVARALLAFAFTATAYALFCSSELVSLAYDLPENPTTRPLVVAVENWHLAMEALGTAGISDAIRMAVADLRFVTWD